VSTVHHRGLGSGGRNGLGSVVGLPRICGLFLIWGVGSLAGVGGSDSVCLEVWGIFWV